MSPVPSEPILRSHQSLAFLHMPKTGGRSITRLLMEAFGDDLCPHKTWQEIVAHRNELGSYRAIRGHIFAAVTDLLPPESVTAAFFRDPVERALSEYRFIQRTPGHGRYEAVHEQSLIDFVSQPNNLLVYGRFLGFTPRDDDYARMEQSVPDKELVDIAKHRVDQLGFIGLTGEFDRYFRLFEEWLGVSRSPSVPRENIDPRPRQDAPLQVAERIRELGWVDVAIYEHASRVAAARSNPSHDAGASHI